MHNRTSTGSILIPDLNKLSVTTQKELKEQIRQFRNKQKERRSQTTLLRAPIRTLWLCSTELKRQLTKLFFALRQRYLMVGVTVSLLMLLFILKNIEGPHRAHLDYFWKESIWAVEWIVLGILSSVGLGTGLHTFVLYLGPFIAKVALAAGECGTVDFPVHGQGALLCPAGSSGGEVSFWSIIAKVEFAALCWGAGTAIGELPPYFVARGARLSGKSLESVEDEDYDSDEHELSARVDDNADASFVDYLKQKLNTVLSKHTFIAILLMASIPNPLFDIAGLTCGYSLIPFWTFFGATMIGKAFIKANLQTLLVVLMFRKRQLDAITSFIERHMPESLSGRVTAFFERETARFHPKNSSSVLESSVEGKSVFARVWDVVLFLMIFWFVMSIINSTAQGVMMENDRKELDKFKKSKVSTLVPEENETKLKNV